MKLMDPSLFFISDDRIVKAYKNVANKKKETSEDQLEQLNYDENIVQSCLHPQSKQIVPFYSRLSGYVIFNLPLHYLMLFGPNQSFHYNACLHILSQTYTATFNHQYRDTTN